MDIDIIILASTIFIANIVALGGYFDLVMLLIAPCLSYLIYLFFSDYVPPYFTHLLIASISTPVIALTRSTFVLVLNIMTLINMFYNSI